MITLVVLLDQYNEDVPNDKVSILDIFYYLARFTRLVTDLYVYINIVTYFIFIVRKRL